MHGRGMQRGDQNLRLEATSLDLHGVWGVAQHPVFQREGSNMVAAGSMLLGSMLMGGRDGRGWCPMSIH